ncbi:Fe(3+) ABC transporter substrate-binding protein [Mesobacillus harenae]|uniref:Fe(3+) ABC transporter substrate-binding protein n=1 Tax=Mesobacillus harenae TaxID=2213203 RepID=UPI00157FCC75|nr:Fe(3+) ABC transporter substrate-binding protein [Mesobacillus harenae]
MKKSFLKKGIMVMTTAFMLAACSGNETQNANETSKPAEKPETGEVNLYTGRHYDTDDQLYKAFTEETGIKVNVIKGEEDELIERLSREGDATEGDLFFAADAGRLHWAKEKDLLQSVESETLDQNIPENLRDKDNQWYAMTKRARVIVYAKDRVNPEQLSTYEDLTDEKWKGKVLIRSSENVYNQSLLASFMELNGEEAAKEWAEGIVANMARDPKGGDTDQLKAVVAGEGDLAVMNTYYVGRLANSTNPEEVKLAEQVGVFFPNQDTNGTHVNISGIGVTKHAKNKENAVKFMEFLSSEEAQKLFAEGNNEYPANPDVESSELLKSWGEFKAQDIHLNILGERNADAVKLFNEVGWK